MEKIKQKNNRISSGKEINYNLKISKHKLPFDANICTPDKLPQNLRQTSSNLANIVRSRFGTIFKRGLIEYKPIGKVQRSSKVKLHNKHTENNSPFY